MWAASTNRHCEIFARPVVCPQSDIVIDRTVTFYRHARTLLVRTGRICTHACVEPTRQRVGPAIVRCIRPQSGRLLLAKVTAKIMTVMKTGLIQRANALLREFARYAPRDKRGSLFKFSSLPQICAREKKRRVPEALFRQAVSRPFSSFSVAFFRSDTLEQRCALVFVEGVFSIRPGNPLIRR